MTAKETRMAMTRWLTLAAFAAAGYAVFRRTAQRELARPHAAPEHLQTWEGEGGAVPVGGSRIAAAHPPKSDDLRRREGADTSRSDTPPGLGTL
jgi:hypothetical protein